MRHNTTNINKRETKMRNKKNDDQIKKKLTFNITKHIQNVFNNQSKYIYKRRERNFE